MALASQLTVCGNARRAVPIAAVSTQGRTPIQLSECVRQNAILRRLTSTAKQMHIQVQRSTCCNFAILAMHERCVLVPLTHHCSCIDTRAPHAQACGSYPGNDIARVP
eukprot:12038386-Alexandrium_andersonii.AAC.1